MDSTYVAWTLLASKSSSLSSVRDEVQPETSVSGIPSPSVSVSAHASSGKASDVSSVPSPSVSSSR